MVAAVAAARGRGFGEKSRMSWVAKGIVSTVGTLDCSCYRESADRPGMAAQTSRSERMGFVPGAGVENRQA